MTVVMMEAAAAAEYFASLPKRTPERQASLNLATRGYHITGPYRGDPSTRAVEWRCGSGADGWDLPAGSLLTGRKGRSVLGDLHMPWVTVWLERGHGEAK